MMDVPRVQTKIVSIRKIDSKDGSSVLNRRNSLYDVPIQVAVVMLREINEVGWP